MRSMPWRPRRLPGAAGLSAAAYRSWRDHRRRRHARAGLGVEPVPDRLAAGRPDRSRAQRQADDDRSRRRADFQALYRDHAEPDGALRRHRAPRRLEPLRDRRRRRLPQPGRIAVEGDASTASYFLALGAIGGGPLRSAAWAPTASRATWALPRRWRIWAPRSATVRLDRGQWRERRRRRAAQGLRYRFQPDPRRGHDRGRAGPVCRRPVPAAQHRQLAREGTDRIHAMQTELEKLGATVESGPDCARRRPSGAAGAMRTSAPGTTIAWPCAFPGRVRPGRRAHS